MNCLQCNSINIYRIDNDVTVALKNVLAALFNK